MWERCKGSRARSAGERLSYPVPVLTAAMAVDIGEVVELMEEDLQVAVPTRRARTLHRTRNQEQPGSHTSGTAEVPAVAVDTTCHQRPATSLAPAKHHS